MRVGELVLVYLYIYTHWIEKVNNPMMMDVIFRLDNSILVAGIPLASLTDLHYQFEIQFFHFHN